MSRKYFSSVLILGLVLVALFLGGLPRVGAQESWSIYIYMCGSDLETESGYASENLQDLMNVNLPENVKFVVQTGGTKEWHTEGIPSNAIGRFVYDNQGWHSVEKLPDANMGEESTLESFLRFAKEKYPAEHRMLIFYIAKRPSRFDRVSYRLFYRSRVGLIVFRYLII